MDAELKKKWVKALRSGRYKQADNGLKINDSYCCLGVLANIQGARWRDSEMAGIGLVPFIGGEQASQTKNPDGYLARDFCGGMAHPTQRKLALMNDAGRSFAEIADYIEQHL